MSPEERQLLQGLFDRMQPAASSPRDRDAESMINDAVRRQPYAPYLLAQTVIVQDQALRAANDKLQQLEAHLQEAQRQGQQAPAPQGGGGFLSGIFGGGSQPQQAPRSPWNQGAPQQQQPYPQQSYPQQGGFAPPPPQGGPWGGGQPQPAAGGGFLHGALGAAAGVAGGVLLADSIKGLFGGHNNGLGIASGMGGLGGMGGSGLGGGETIVNNYYGSDQGGLDQGGSNDGGFLPSSDDGQGYDSGQDQGYDDGSTDI